jgi:4-amino-4-deoxy-L-arabinose transferase-like glycosyltransferase
MNWPALRSPRARRIARTWLPLVALIVIGCFVLFYNYGSGTFSRWDEGLYGQFARNALTFHDYLLPLDTRGNYSREPFSKPPLSFLLVALSFTVFQPSIESLRFPFTLGSLLLALICWAWGNDISRRLKAGPWLGFVWGLFMLLSEASMIWGRYAVIEDVFVMFMTLALWLHTRALTRGWVWSLLAGLALCLAFSIKQLAVGIAILPMLLLELLHLREHGAWRVARRSLLWAVPPLLVALTWAYLAYAREGERFAGMLWTFALVQRFQGYQGTVHFNTFNRVSGLLDQASSPFSWLLGALGLLVFVDYVLRRRVSGARAQLSIVLFFLTSVLVLENATKSLLPWYVYSFMPSVTLGLAWLSTQGYRALAVCWREPERRLRPYWVAVAALASAVLFLALAEGLRQVASQVNIAVLLLALGALAVHWRTRRARPAWAAPAAGFAAVLALLTLAHFRNIEYRQSPGALEVLMGAVGRARLEHPVVSAAVNKSDVENYEPTTLFGSRVRVGSAPWLDPTGSVPADGFVDLFVVPSEVDALAPGRIVRAPGATLFLGDLRTNPVPDELVASLLAAGPLTFEAESMDSAKSTSLTSDSRASGGMARRYKPWFSEGSKDHSVSLATTTRLPPGDYVAEVYVRWRCGAQKGAEIGSVKAGKRQRKLSCKTLDHLDAYRAIPVRFSLDKTAGVPLSVAFDRGRGELWHDRTLIWRAEAWDKKAEAKPAE